MKFFGYELKAVPQPTANNDVGDVGTRQNSNAAGILKAYIPEYLYKPPYGYPRPENLPLIRQLAKNPYVFSVVKTLCDEAASTPYDIVYKEEAVQTPELDAKRLEILKFFDNPNRNKESFATITRAMIKDIIEVDAGVMVKVFNKKEEMVEVFARGGDSFLKNPDPFGYMGNRADFVLPTDALGPQGQPGMPMTDSVIVHQYGNLYNTSAAYFQYGTTAMALPVPFGKREIIYVMQNPQGNSVYGVSPIQILADVIMTLVYGSNYNLDFYMNNNMPEGIITLLGADADAIKNFRARFDQTFRVKDPVTGFNRKIAFKYPIVNQEAKFTQFQLNPEVMQIIEQQQWFTKLVWACVGITADEMGFTESSNRAVGESQSKINIRKGVRPMLQLLKYHWDKELIAEWGPEVADALEFKYDDYDLDTDIKRHQLYESQIRMGIKTPEMVALEEGIDVNELKKQKDEKMLKELAYNVTGPTTFPVEEKEPKEETKSETFDNDLEKELVTSIRSRAKELSKAIDNLKNRPIDKL